MRSRTSGFINVHALVSARRERDTHLRWRFADEHREARPFDRIESDRTSVVAMEFHVVSDRRGVIKVLGATSTALTLRPAVCWAGSPSTAGAIMTARSVVPVGQQIPRIVRAGDG